MCLCETYLLGQQLKAQHEFFIHFSEKKRKEKNEKEREENKTQGGRGEETNKQERKKNTNFSFTLSSVSKWRRGMAW